MTRPAKDARDAVQLAHPGAIVIERKRNSIKHQIASDQFVLDVGIGPMHYGPLEDQEIDTAWVPSVAPWDWEMTQAGYTAHALSGFSSGQIIRYTHPRSGENIHFQPQQLQYTNDLDQIQAIANPQTIQAQVVDEDVLLWTGAYGPGFDLRWQAQTARLDKRLIVDLASRFPAPEQFIIDGGNPVLRFQFIFAVSSGVDIYVNDQLWTRGPNSRVDTQGYVEFRMRATGEVLWSFNLPRSFKNEEDPILLGIFRLRRQANSLFVEHRIPLLELRAATYPVEIDTTIDEQVGASADDGFSTDGAFELYDNNDTLSQLGASSSGTGFWLNNWCRFTGISGLSGATITSAYISYWGHAADTGTPETLIYAEDAAAPTAPTSRADFNGRTKTTANVTWDNLDLVTTAFTNSPSIVSIIQELADSYDSSVIQILHMDDLFTDFNNYAFVRMYDGDTSQAAKLHIEYTAAAAGNPWYAYAQQ